MLGNHHSKIDLGDILIVDDEIPNLQLLSELLGKEGYHVRKAKQPKMAIKSAVAQPPSLILLDVRMPEMDGFEVCRRLKQEAQTRDIPIIFVSALQDTQDRVRGFEAGGVDFISKPFQEPEVLARVRTHLALRNQQLHLEDLVTKRTGELSATNEELVKSEAKYRGLVDTSLVGVFHSRINGQFVFVNEALARMFDFDSPEQMVVEGSISRWRDPNRRELFLATLREQGYVTNFETEMTTRRGRPVHVLFSATQDGDNISGMLMDITERKRIEQKILDYQQRLKALATQLTIAEEKERRVIATDLHDQVGYSLSLANMQLNEILEADSVVERTLLVKDISNILLKALQDTRSLIFELSSPTMNEIGLAAAISEWLEEQIAKRHDLKIEFIDATDDNHKKTLDSNVRALLFRNVRELLTNVIKHSRAQNVRVQIISEGSCLKITVEDDGVGFNPDADNTKQKAAEGFGLFSIQERMTDIGGSFDIQSHPGKGCRMTLISPPIAGKG
jgi:PAS domain S-box-containing protein